MSEAPQFRHRQNWRGKLILQVAEQRPYNYDPLHDWAPGGYYTAWRDATFQDLPAANTPCPIPSLAEGR